jgi:hypothetical protein
MPRYMSLEAKERARERDRIRSKDPKRKEQQRISARARWANDPSVRERHKVAQDNWVDANRDANNAYRAAWAKEDRASYYTDARVYEFAREMKKYGTTVEWYRDRLVKQVGLCAVCGHLSHHRGALQRLQVDHNHECCDLKTKSCGECLRGLLCAKCNLRLATVEAVLKEGTVIPTPDTWLSHAMHYLSQYDGSASTKKYIATNAIAGPQTGRGVKL